MACNICAKFEILSLKTLGIVDCTNFFRSDGQMFELTDGYVAFCKQNRWLCDFFKLQSLKTPFLSDILCLSDFFLME